MPNITILNGEEIGKTYSWTADQIRIGRNSANDFSTNGTRVNDQRITMATLRRNDVVTLGDIAISIRGDDVPEAEPGQVESVDSIPRTTIVMRPTVTPTKPAEGFSKKSESKKMLNLLIGAIIVIILVAFVVLLMKM